jgi:hypothetical protein
MSFSFPFALAPSFPLFIWPLELSYLYPTLILIHPEEVYATLEKRKPERKPVRQELC